MMKESINQGGKVIINLYAPNSRHSNKQSRKNTHEMQNKKFNYKIVGVVNSQRSTIICRKFRHKIIEKRRFNNTFRLQRTGNAGVLRSMGSQRARHDCVTEHTHRHIGLRDLMHLQNTVPRPSMCSVIRPSPPQTLNTFIGIERMQIMYPGHNGMELEMSIIGRHLEISHKTIHF